MNMLAVMSRIFACMYLLGERRSVHTTLVGRYQSPKGRGNVPSSRLSCDTIKHVPIHRYKGGDGREDHQFYYTNPLAITYIEDLLANTLALQPKRENLETNYWQASINALF